MPHHRIEPHRRHRKDSRNGRARASPFDRSSGDELNFDTTGREIPALAAMFPKLRK
jgi:hypothetical protein